jgi:hypothetical protein
MEDVLNLTVAVDWKFWHLKTGVGFSAKCNVSCSR